MSAMANFVAFQLAWFSTVLGAANGLPLLGPLVVSLVIILHLYLANDHALELRLILIAAIIGAAFDSTLVAAGWLAYPSGTLVANAAPYWIVAIWMLFATTLNVSFRWLRERMWLAALLGAIAGPASYYGGHRLGGLDFVHELAGLSALSLGWAVLLPLMLILSRRFDGFAVTVEESQFARGW